MYRVGGDVHEGKDTKVNPHFMDLLGKVVSDTGKVHILGSHVISLEEHLVAQEGRLNFLLLVLGEGGVIMLTVKP